jgi:hypothetical protein
LAISNNSPVEELISSANETRWEIWKEEETREGGPSWSIRGSGMVYVGGIFEKKGGEKEKGKGKERRGEREGREEEKSNAMYFC